MCDLNDGASSDSDIFIIKQIKPVNKLTLKSTSLKQTVLNSFRSKKVEKNKEKEKLSIKSKPKRGAKKSPKSSKVSKKNSAMYSNSIKKFFVEIHQGNKKEAIEKDSKNEVDSEICITEEITKSDNVERISKNSSGSNKQFFDLFQNHKNEKQNLKKRSDLSPSDSPERKKLKNNIVISSPSCNSATSSVSQKSSERENSVDLSEKSEDVIFEELFSPSQLEIEFSLEEGLNENFKNGSGLLCHLLKKIINDERKKQVELEQESFLNGKTMEKLFSEDEDIIFEQFFNLNENACKLFVRMLGRKKDWHRVSALVYDDIGGDLKKHFVILKEVNFVDTNIEDDDFETQMNLLSKPEIKKLCKSFNINSKTQNIAKKEILISSLIKECQKQKSVLEIINNKSITSRSDLLKLEVKNLLGMCIKINRKTFEAFNKIMILFSFPHYSDEEEKRFSNELFMHLKVYRNMIKFPEYELSPCVVFQMKSDFEEYVFALNLLSDFEAAVNNKNHDEFMKTVMKVKERFKNVLKDDGYKERYLNLPSFLKKFTAGTVYARILTKYCQTFKKKADQSDIMETVNLLLEQEIFLKRKKGEWYEILSKALENKKETNSAGEVILKSLSDPGISEVQKLTLQLRGQGLIKRKTNGMSDVALKEELEKMCTLSVQEPDFVEIRGKALEGNESGFKCVYVQDTENGKKYISVEERAICYYKSRGYSKGYHVEGSIIHTIYFLLFFDVIYGTSPKGVFQSHYQVAPLDFYSSLFYLNRKDRIDKLLTDMVSWNDVKIESKLNDVYTRHFGTTCVISWSDEFTPEIFREVIKCITMPILVIIFRRLVQNFSVYRSGFPDLTLWNPESNKIKFVEVKSPNDKLSPAQRVWLNYLKSIGLSAEVCNVKNSSGLNCQ